MRNQEDVQPQASPEFMEALNAASERGGQSSGVISSPGRSVPVEGAYALVTRRDLTALAHQMPDAQSSVLACLGWQASLQQRLTRGPHAMKRLARISAGTLAKLTGKPLRSVKWALAKLESDGLIRNEEARPGRTAVYRILTLDQQPA